MSLHHTQLIADLCELLEPVYMDFPAEVVESFQTCKELQSAALTDGEGRHTEAYYSLRTAEAVIDDTVEGIMKDARRLNLTSVLNQMDGSSCKRSLVREALRQLDRESASAVLVSA